jgi:hypothetical protein
MSLNFQTINCLLIILGIKYFLEKAYKYPKFKVIRGKAVKANKNKHQKSQIRFLGFRANNRPTDILIK